MKQPASAKTAPAKNVRDHTKGKTRPVRRTRRAAAPEAEAEPRCYTSPPCYLAEFSGEDFAEQTSK